MVCKRVQWAEISGIARFLVEIGVDTNEKSPKLIENRRDRLQLRALSCSIDGIQVK